MAGAVEAVADPPKILVVDDDVAVVRFLATRCRAMGFDVQQAFTGSQALLMARRSRPAVLIVDVEIPELNGLAVCMRLMDPAQPAIKVIVMTGHSSPVTIEWCEQFGAVHCLKGPDAWMIARSALQDLFPFAQRGDDISGSDFPCAGKARPCLLVVDEDPQVGLLLTSRLRAWGMDTLAACGGIVGYRLAREAMPDVILADYAMQDGDIGSFMRRLRSTVGTASIPVLVACRRRPDLLTELNLRSAICGHRGVLRFLMKPLDVDELIGTLRHLCAPASLAEGGAP